MTLARTLAFTIVAAMAAMAADATHWVATWGAAASPQLDVAQLREQHLEFDGQTVRQIVRVSVGGNAIRVRLTNAFSDRPVIIGEAHVALRGSGAAIAAGSDHPLLFSGRRQTEIPAGAIVVSDPVNMKLGDLADLAVSLFVPGQALAGGIHYSAQQTSYVAQGNTSGASDMPGAVTMTSWAYLAGVDVLAPAAAAAIVAFGDSITDGARSTIDANKRWPNILASRLLARKGGTPLAVVDMGIGGNRILHEGAASKRPQFGVNALARFDRDVLSVPGVKYLMVLEGINDIGHAGSSAPASEAVSAQDLIAGLTQMIERAHENGIKVIVGTLTPFEGEANIARGYYTPEKEKVRLALNEWIRTAKVHDGFVDFEKAIRDPQRPGVVQKALDSGDALHPSDAGYTAMGEAVSLGLFR